MCRSVWKRWCVVVEQVASAFMEVAERYVPGGPGVVVRWAANSWFDSLLYPFMIALLGVVGGGLVMTVLSIVFNIIIISNYDIEKRDYLLLKSLYKWVDKVKELLGKQKLLAECVVFLGLSFDDPITVTLHYTNHRAVAFIFGTVVGNVYWTLRAGAIWEGFKFSFRLLFGS